MSTVSSFMVVLLSLSFTSAQEATKDNQQQEIPATLAEAHAELERILSPQTLAEIDAMPSERDMIKYHFSLGLSMRNGWGLWRGSPLAKHMQELGFTHPDDMSSVILETFWRKRHGQDLDLEELAAAVKKSMEAAKNAQEEEERRVRETNAAMRNMIMGLRFQGRDVPIVRMPDRTDRYLKARFVSPFRGGVFLTAYRRGRLQDQAAIMEGVYVDPADGKVHKKPEYDDFVARGHYHDPTDRSTHKMKPGDDFYTWGYYFDPADRKIHEIRVAEVNEVYAAVVAGGKAWFAGITKGETVLVGVNGQDRITVPLPREDEIPDLGLDGRSLLAVYPKTIFRLTDRTWTLVHSGDILLPRSGLPPQRHGDMVFLRDEEGGARCRRLWWLTLGEQPHLSALDHDAGLPGPSVTFSTPFQGGTVDSTIPSGTPGWDEVSSYCVTKSGDLWACVAGGSFLLRRSKDGSYSVAIMNNSVRYTEDRPDTGETDQRVSVSAITALPDDTLLLAGQTGLYRLKGNELVQELAFTREKVVDSRGRTYSSSWTPNTVLSLDDRTYVIGTAKWGGVYLLRKDDDGRWSCLPLEDVRDTVVW